MIIFLNLFKVRARAAKVTFVCYFRYPRGLLSRARDMFHCFAAKHLKFDSIIVISARSRLVSAPVVDMFLISAFRS